MLAFPICYTVLSGYTAVQSSTRSSIEERPIAGTKIVLSSVASATRPGPESRLLVARNPAGSACVELEYRERADKN